MSDLPTPQSIQDPPTAQPSRAGEAQPRSNPYVGPRAFQFGERIYGRDLETYKLANLLSAERIVLFYSPSGAGKSSLIHAALIPELEEREFFIRAVARVNREPAKPPANLPPSYNRYIFSVLSWLESAWPESEQIPEEELVGMRLADYLEHRPRREDTNFEVFIFDQFEEILTLDATDQEAKHEFFEQIGDLLSDRTRWALFSMREDFKAALDPYVLPIPTRFSATFRLELLGVEAARQAMQSPAMEAGVEFTRPAADALIDDLRLVQVQNPDGTYRPQPGPSVEPVQLQVVCYRLWESLDPGSTCIDTQHLARIKNVGQALADYYALRVAEAAEKADVSERLIRQWFERELITEGGIRNQVLMGTHSSRGLDNRAIRLLEDAHLVRAEKRGNSIWYELSHDRLIEPVKGNNAAWFEHNLSLLQRQAALWNDEGRPEGLLILGNSLVDIRAWAKTHITDMMPAEMDFLAACNKAQKTANRELWRNRIMAVLAILVTIAAIAALFAWRSSVRSETRAETNARTAETQAALAKSAQQVADVASTQAVAQRGVAEVASTQAVEQKDLAEIASTQAVSQKNLADIASTQALEQRSIAKTAEAEAVKQRNFAEQEHINYLSRQLVASSRNVRTTAPDLSLLLGVEAILVGNTTEAQANLLQGLAYDRPLAYLRGHTDSIYDLEFSPDNHWLASAGWDGTRLWEVDLRSPVTQTLPGTYGAARVAFSPDSNTLVTLSCYGFFSLQDLTQKVLEPPSGQFLPSIPNNCNEPILGDLVFSPDGTMLAASLNSNQVVLLNLTTSQAITLTGSNDLITRLAFSPDSALLASGDNSGKVNLWDVNTGTLAQPQLEESPLTNPISILIFFPGSDSDFGLGAIDAGGMLVSWSLGKNQLEGEPQETEIKNITAISFDAELIVSLEKNTVLVGSDPAELKPLTGHSDLVTAVAISPDGLWLASGSWNGELILWDMRTHIQADPSIQTTSPILSLVYTQAEGVQVLMGSSQDRLFLWDAASHQIIRQQELPVTVSVQITVTPRSLAFRPDGTLVSGGEDGSAFVWDLDRDQSERRHTSELQRDSPINSISVSPGGEKIAVGQYGLVTVWDISTTKVMTRSIDYGDIYYPTFSLDGKVLAISSYYGSVFVWNLATGETNPKIYAGGSTSIALSPDGKRLATGGYSGSIEIWDTQTSELITSMIADSTMDIQALAFSPDGNFLASGSSDGSITIWELNADSPAEISVFTQASILCLAFSPDGKFLASGDEDGIVRLWDAPSGYHGSTLLTGHTGAVTSLAFSLDGGRLASTSNDNTVRVWDVRTGQTEGHPLAGQILRSFAPSASSQAISADGRRMATGSYENGLITLFDLTATPPVTQVLIAHRDKVNILTFSPDGQYLASGGSDGRLILWDAISGARLNYLLVKPDTTINILKFSPDSKILVAGVDADIYRWNVSTAKTLGNPLKGHNNAVIGLAFSPDGSLLASQGREGTILLWDTNSGRLVRKIENQVEYSSYNDRDTLVFSQDGNQLVSGLASVPYAITLWEVSSGKPLGNLTGHRNDIVSLTFSLDGSTLVSRDLDNHIIFWQISPQAWRVRACDLVGRNLSWQEWEAYLAESGQSYRATCPSNPINYDDIAQGYVDQILFLIEAQDIEQAWKILIQAVNWITPLEALEPAVILCQLDLPPGLFVILAPVCQMAARLEPDGMASAEYSLKIGDKDAAIQTLQESTQQAIATKDMDEASRICDFGVSNAIPEGANQACLYAAENAILIYNEAYYYIQAGAIFSATSSLQRAVQLAVMNNSFDLAASICRLGNDHQLSSEVTQACLVAAQTAPDDASRVEFYSLGGDNVKAAQALQKAAGQAMDIDDSYTAGILCTDGAKYHLQPANREACLFAAETTTNYQTSADFYALAGELQKAGELFTLALRVALASSDLSDDNALCWVGSLDGFAALVIPACENAVANAAEQESALFMDAQGLARALTGNFKGAIADFQAFLDWLNTDGYYSYDTITRERYIAERQSWIAALQEGRNPFDETTLMALRDE